MIGSLLLVVGMVLQTVAPDDVPGASLRGSPAAMAEQHQIAQEYGLPFFQTEAEIREAVAQGVLVELPGDENYEVAGFVNLPYLYPAARSFVERTAALYREACGEKLVVTSGVRAIANQPPNAHALSVHPAGMAVDLRVSQQQECRDWLENKMLALEQQGLINGIREFRPPHYHIAVYPERYAAYLAAQTPDEPGLTEPVDPTQPRFGWLGVVALLVALVIGFGLLSRWLQTRSPEEQP